MAPTRTFLLMYASFSHVSQALLTSPWAFSRRHDRMSTRCRTYATTSTSNSGERDSSLTRSGASQALDGTVILGGGIAGLSTAASLQSIAGVQNLQILEKLDAESFSNDRAGAAAQLGPNGLRALRAIGGEALMNEVLSLGTKLAGNTMLMPHLPEPMTIPDTAEADTGLPQVLLRWGVLRRLLYESIPSDCISFGVGNNVLGYNTKECGGVRLVQEDGEEVGPTAPLIVAADGIYSTFRQCLATDTCSLDNIDDRTMGIKYNQRVNIKAVTKGNLDESKYKPNHTYSFFSPDGGVACFAGPAGEGYTYWAISVADNTEGNSEDATTCEIMELVSCKKSAQLKKEAIKEALLKKLRGLDEPLVNFAVDKIDETPADDIYIQHSEEAEEIGPCLVSTDGNVVLVGDAGHSMSPSYGQGANFALEDAASLAVCIRDSDDVSSALNSYEESRLGRCQEMLQRSADRAAKAMKGEETEDVSKWIFEWDLPGN